MTPPIDQTSHQKDRIMKAAKYGDQLPRSQSITPS